MAAATECMWAPTTPGSQLQGDASMRLLAAVQQSREHQQQHFPGESSAGGRLSPDSGLPGVAVVGSRYSPDGTAPVPSYVPTVVDTPELKNGDGTILCQVGFRPHSAP